MKNVFLILLLLTGLSGYAQKFSDNPEEFLDQATDLLKDVNKTESDKAAEVFSASWESFSPENKKKIIEVARLMEENRLRASVDFTDFFAIMGYAASKHNLPDTEIDTLTQVISSVIQENDNKERITCFANLKEFLETEYLYQSSYNALKQNGGNFKIRYKSAAPAMTEIDYLDQQAEEGAGETEEEQANGEEDWFSDWDDAGTDDEEEDYNTAWEDDWSDDSWEEDDGWDSWESSEPEDTETGSTDSWEDPASGGWSSNVMDVGYTAPPQPEVKGPVVIFEDSDLIMTTRHDSTTIKNTGGSWMLHNDLFVGEGGTFDWSTIGMAPEELYVEFDKYNFKVISPTLEAEPVELHYPSRTDSVVEGVFEFQSKGRRNDKEADFPRFKSFNSDIPVKGLGRNIDYKGGLSLAGRKIYSSSIDEGYSRVNVKKDDSVKIKAISTRFELGDSSITANVTDITLYQNKDSIYHPGAIFDYDMSRERLRLTKTSSFRHSPFIDTYHNIQITADAITWDLNSPEMQFSITNAPNEIPALFESQEFFSEEKYAQMMGIQRFHPLGVLVFYGKKVKKDKFYVGDVAREMNILESTLRKTSLYLMKQGYIDYNSKTGWIVLRDKAKHYVLSRQNKKDYDNMKFISLEPGGNNATLNLDNNELTVRGVDKVYIMDSLDVFIVPDSKTIVIKNNRDFSFDGKINTANFQFVGYDFEFNYDSFLVHMPEIDQIRLATIDKSSSGDNQGKTRVLGNELRYSSGTLYINKPDNKSGRKKYEKYPIFDANSGASVFFNKNDIAGGAYDTSIKFKIPPFEVDSLSSNDPQAIGFDGEFESGGIFPPFKTKLVLMEDFSLGFKYDAPEEGFQLYEGNGKFYNKIRMDSKGLTGNGKIEFLNTTCYSDEFYFFKDSVITIGTKSVTSAGINPKISDSITFPDFNVTHYEMLWRPRADSMLLTNISEPFQFYDSTAILHGTANITNSGMYGTGVLETRGTLTASPNFHFEEHQYEGRNSTFTVKSDKPGKPALQATNVKLEFNLKDESATFQPEVEGFASTEFPDAQYKTSIDKGIWDMKEKKVVMSTPEGSDINNSYFYSTHPDQDSLVFNAAAGVYDMETYSLNISGVPYIHVYDGKIIPDSNKVVIRENAQMDSLYNSRLYFDTINEYHHLFDASIAVKGKYDIRGNGTYDYTNPNGDKFHIQFKNFIWNEPEKKKEDPYTISQGIIQGEDSIYMAKKILYKGKVTMYSKEKPLYMDGYVKLDLKGALSYSQWLKFKNDGDTSNVKIILEDPKADNGNPLTTGLHQSLGTRELYTTFISEKDNNNDDDLFLAKGILKLSSHPDSSIFRVGPEEKFNSEDPVPGNVFTYNDDLSIINYSGQFNYMKSVDDFILHAVGDGKGILDSTLDYRTNNLFAFEWDMHKKVAEPIGEDLKQVVDILPPDSAELIEDYAVLLRKKEQLDNKLLEMGGTKDYLKYKKKTASEDLPLYELTKTLEKSWVVSDVDMKWSNEHKAWYSTKPSFKIANILDIEIDRYVKGYLEIRKGGDGSVDTLNMLIQPTENRWYYITYDNNRLAVTTSDSELNEAVDKKSDGDLMSREKFFFTQADITEKETFLRDFYRRYLDTTYSAYNQERAPKEVEEVEIEDDLLQPEDDGSEREEASEPLIDEPERKREPHEGRQIEEPEFRRREQNHSVEEKEESRKAKEKVKDLFK